VGVLPRPGRGTAHRQRIFPYSRADFLRSSAGWVYEWAMRLLLPLVLLAACSPQDADPGPQAAVEAPVQDPGAGPGESVPASARIVIPLVTKTDRGAGDLDPNTAFLRWRGSGQVLGQGNLVSELSPDGAFAFDVPAGQAIEVEVLAGDRRTALRFDPLEAGQTEHRMAWLQAGLRRVSGVLIDPNGVPLEGSRVRANGDATLTNSRGRFVVSVPAGLDEMEVFVPGWPPVTVALPPPDESEAEVEVTLVTGARLRATLRDSAGAPAQGRLVAWAGGRLVAWAWGEPGEAWAGRTDGTGVAHLRGLPTGVPLGVWVLAPDTPTRRGRLLLEVEPDLVLEGGETRELDLSLPPPGPIAGRLVDQDGRPLAQVELCLAVPGEGELDATYLQRNHSVRARTVTEADGSFRFEDAPGGVWLVGVARGPWNARIPLSGRVSPAALPARTADEEVLLQVAVGLSLRGKVVTADGEPAPRVTVVARPQGFHGERDVRTKADGTYELKGLLPGAHDIYLRGRRVLSDVDPSRGTPLPQIHIR
jgi:hypothetical protein